MGTRSRKRSQSERYLRNRLGVREINPAMIGANSVSAYGAGAAAKCPENLRPAVLLKAHSSANKPPVHRER